MNNDTKLSSTDTTRFDDANADTIWDPRADLPLTRQATRSPRLRLQTPGVFRRVKGMDDDGDIDASDETAYDLKYSDWSGANPSVDPRQAFSDVGNPFMPALYVAERCQGFQGIPHFALDTSSSATEGKLMLNHHRARFACPVTGRWITRDPLFYNHLTLSTLYLFESQDFTRTVFANVLSGNSGISQILDPFVSEIAQQTASLYLGIHVGIHDSSGTYVNSCSVASPPTNIKMGGVRDWFGTGCDCVFMPVPGTGSCLGTCAFCWPFGTPTSWPCSFDFTVTPTTRGTWVGGQCTGCPWPGNNAVPCGC